MYKCQGPSIHVNVCCVSVQRDERRLEEYRSMVRLTDVENNENGSLTLFPGQHEQNKTVRGKMISAVIGGPREGAGGGHDPLALELF